MVGNGGDDAVFKGVARFEAEDADGFDADILVGGGVYDGGIGIVGDGAGQDVGGAAAGVGDVDERDFDGLKGAVEVEIEAGELADAEFAVDVDAGVDFLAAGAVGFETVARFEEFDLGGIFGLFRGSRLCIFFVGGFFDCFLGGFLGDRDARDRGDENQGRGEP